MTSSSSYEPSYERCLGYVEEIYEKCVDVCDSGSGEHAGSCYGGWIDADFGTVRMPLSFDVQVLTLT